MQCYKCDNHLASGTKCEYCGADVTYYKKIVYTSNGLYNIALEKAQARDLTGAIYYLQNSLKMYKKNISARNLLGLVYYEVGEVADALAQWVISKNMQPDENLADEYINAIQNNHSKLDTISQMTRRFNKALDYVNQGNTDLAIIQLKKVLSTNSSFVKAGQLLALIYMKNKDYEKARKTIINVLKVDTTNTRSIRYLAEIRQELSKEEFRVSPKEKKARKALEGPKKALNGNDVIIPSYSFKEYSPTRSVIINIIIGIIIGAAVILFLVTPAKMASVKSDYNQTALDYESQITSLEATIDQLESDAEDAEEEEENSVDYETLSADYEYLVIAYNAFTNENYIRGADNILKISTLKSKTSAFKSLYNTIYDDLLSEALDAAEDEAWDYYDSEDYENAVKYFKKCYNYDSTEGEYLYDVALSYELNGDTDNALKYYEKVVDKFPDTTEATNAESKIDSLS